MKDFLPQLRRTNTFRQASNKSIAAENDVFIMIGFETFNNNRAFISIVNKKGKTIAPDYRNYTGETFNILRTISTIQKESQSSIEWDASIDVENSGIPAKEHRIYLDNSPYLIYQLLRCRNLVNKDMNPVKVHDEETAVELTLVQSKKTVTPLLSLRNSEGGQELFSVLTDSFVLGDSNTIYPVKPLGENYDKLEFFKTTFDAGLQEKFLSVFYSYINNVSLCYEDYELVYSQQSIKAQPTLIFEKVDTDQALYLRLSQGIHGLDFDFVSQFDLIYIASIQEADRIVTLRRIESQTLDMMASSLSSMIGKFAPSRSAQKEVYNEGGLFIIPAETAGPFLLGSLPALVRDYILVGAEKLKDYKVKAVKPSVKVNIGSGIDFLEGEASIQLGDEEFTLGQFLKQYNKNKYIILNDGNRAIIDEGYVRRLERIFTKGKKSNSFKVSFFDLPEVEDLIGERMQGEAFEHHRKVYEGFNNLSKQKMTFPKVKATLRPYQEEGVKWINYLYENNLGGCLADDMGLGKTLQTISMLVRIYPKTKTPTLIVMPRSLIFNWNSEIAKFAPHLKAYTYYGTTRNMDEAMKHQVILTTYAIVRNDIEQFKDLSFHYIILDESQNIKNVSAQATQAVMLLRSKHRLALSGTPIENNLTELYSLFRFLNPAMFGSLDDFNRQYTYPIQRDDDKEVMAALRRKIFPFMLRRLKKDVLDDLPERIDQKLYVEMEPSHAALYEKRRAYFAETVKQQIAADGIDKAQFIMFQALNELRRLASVPESVTDNAIESPKIGMMIDSLLDAISNGHKIVVFFNYIAGLDIVGEKLAEAGIDYAVMTGATNNRQQVVERFQNNPQCRVMLMTLKTGGVGLNLTAADTVYIFEPWWNKAAEEQAINRLHRIGQKATVLSYSIITRGTIEEKIEILQQQKAELFNGLIGADSSSTKHLTEEDIRFILE